MRALDTLKKLNITAVAENKTDMQRQNQIEIKGEEDELVIIDEADSFILESNIDITAPNVVGLTATALDDLEDDSAKSYLIKYLDFRVYNSAI